jgi:hypothetical protein
MRLQIKNMQCRAVASLFASPVIDENGIVVGVITGPTDKIGTGGPAPSDMEMEEIGTVLERVGM